MNKLLVVLLVGAILLSGSVVVLAVDLSDVCEGVIFALGVFGGGGRRGSTEPYYPGGVDTTVAARGASEFYW